MKQRTIKAYVLHDQYFDENKNITVNFFLYINNPLVV